MPTISETKTYFDKAAFDLARENLVDKWRSVAKLFGPTEAEANVLECGAGTGLYTLPMLRRGFNVTSIDLSPGSLDQLRRSVEERPDLDPRRLTVVCGDFLTAAKDLDATFDVVTFFKVMHHFPDRQYIRDALHRAFDLIRPGGRIVAFEPNGACPLWWVRYRVLESKESWENERNLLLIRKRFFDTVFADLPNARVTFGYNYVVPGSLVNRWSALARADGFLCRLAPFNRYAVNLSFVIEKPA